MAQKTLAETATRLNSVYTSALQLEKVMPFVENSPTAEAATVWDERLSHLVAKTYHRPFCKGGTVTRTKYTAGAIVQR